MQNISDGSKANKAALQMHTVSAFEWVSFNHKVRVQSVFPPQYILPVSVIIHREYTKEKIFFLPPLMYKSICIAPQEQAHYQTA